MEDENNFALSLMGSSEGLEAWEIKDLWAEPMGAIVLLAERSDDSASLEVRIEPAGYERQALVETPMGKVSHGATEGLTSQEAGEIVRLFAKQLVAGKLPIPLHFPHLTIANPAQKDRSETQKLLGSIVQAQQKLLPDLLSPTDGVVDHVAQEELFFDPPGLAEFLAPDLAIDGAPIAGFILRSIALPPVARRANQHFNQYVLDFEHSHDESLVQINVALEDGLNTEFGNAQSFSVNLKSSGAQADLKIAPHFATLCSWVLALLELKQGEHLTVVQPTSISELRQISVPDRGAAIADISTDGSDESLQFSQSKTLNLALDADCKQNCTFCSVKTFLPPSDDGPAELEHARAQLRASAAQGVRRLRLNGINPLNFSHVLGVLEAAQDFGFTDLTVYSPSREFGDPSFRAAFLERCPEDLRIYVPLYGMTAKTHDSVTGTEGAYDQVVQGLNGLLRELSPEKVILSTVVVRQNVHELADLSKLATQKGIEHYGLMSYPMRQTTRDPYAESSVRSINIVQSFVDQLKARNMTVDSRPYYFLRTVINHPCVLFHQQIECDLPLFSIAPNEGAPMLEGAANRERSEIDHGSGDQGGAFAAATTPCPHSSSCALAPICPKEHYAVYEQLYGLDEFKPVSVFELYKTRPHSDWRIPTC